MPSSSWKLLGWYYNLRGQAVGIVPTEELMTLIASGTIESQTLVWKIWEDDGGRRHVLQSRAGAALGWLDGAVRPAAAAPAGAR